MPNKAINIRLFRCWLFQTGFRRLFLFCFLFFPLRKLTCSGGTVSSRPRRVILCSGGMSPGWWSLSSRRQNSVERPVPTWRGAGPSADSSSWLWGEGGRRQRDWQTLLASHFTHVFVQGYWLLAVCCLRVLRWMSPPSSTWPSYKLTEWLCSRSFQANKHIADVI